MPTIAVGKGVKAMAARYSRLICMKRTSTAARRAKNRWCASQKYPITTKLRKKLKISASLPLRAVLRSPPSFTFGIPMPTTSSVIAMANTASLKNATRSNSSSSDRRR